MADKQAVRIIKMRNSKLGRTLTQLQLQLHSSASIATLPQSYLVCLLPMLSGRCVSACVRLSHSACRNRTQQGWYVVPLHLCVSDPRGCAAYRFSIILNVNILVMVDYTQIWSKVPARVQLCCLCGSHQTSVCTVTKYVFSIVLFWQ